MTAVAVQAGPFAFVLLAAVSSLVGVLLVCLWNSPEREVES
jgi:hypothetical protein